MSLENLTAELKIKLPEYLESQGIEFTASGAMKCFNPAHNDHSASMQLNTKQDSTYVYCHTCHVTYDIFSAASVLEDLPLGGIDWVENNVLLLAERFGLELLDHKSYLTRDPKYALALRAFKDTAILVTNSKIEGPDALKYIADRGWDDNTIKEWLIGTADCDELVDALCKAGYTSDFLDEIGLIDYRIFNKNNVIFTIRDMNNRVVGFTARRFNEKPKYINSQGVSIYSPYKKSAQLFGADKAKRATGTLFIFEGQGDVITAWQHGITAVSVNGSHISETQVDMLNKLNVSDICLCMDSDEAGTKSLYGKVIPTVLKHQMHPVPKVIIDPTWTNSGLDPDEFLRQHGSAKLKELADKAVLAPYAYGTCMPGANETLCENLIDMCETYRSPIARSIIAKSISDATQVSEAAIFARLEDIEQARLARTDGRKSNVVAQAIKDLGKAPQNASQIMVNSLADLETISHTYDAISSSTFISYLKDIKKEEELREDIVPGFRLRSFPNIEKALRGDWKERMIIIAGDENTGKSTMTDALVYDIVSDPENDAMVIVHLTDDSVKERVQKYICLADREIGDGILTYEKVAYPNWINGISEIALERQIDAREKAYRRFYELCMDERIILKDAKDSIDLEFGRTMLKSYRTKYPNRNIIKVTDSINRARVPMAISDPRMAMTYRSGTIKEDAVKYNSTEIVVAEFNRPLDRTPVGLILPSMKRLAEARALEFDCQAGLLLYNDVHIRGDKATVLWRDQYGNVRPRNIIRIGKNKISNWKGNLIYNFDEVRAKFVEIDNDQANEEMANEERRLREEQEDYDDRVKGDYEDDDDTQAKPKVKILDKIGG